MVFLSEFAAHGATQHAVDGFFTAGMQQSDEIISSCLTTLAAGLWRNGRFHVVFASQKIYNNNDY